MTQTQGQRGLKRNVSTSSVQEQEIYDIMIRAISMGNYHRITAQILKETKNFSVMQQIRSNHMELILSREGGMFENEAKKVVRYLEQDGQVTVGRLD